VYKIRRKMIYDNNEGNNLTEIVEKIKDAILVLNENGRIVFANPKACDMFGKNPDELLFSDFGHFIATDKSIEINIENPKKGTIIAEVLTSEIVWKGKKAWLASLRDITDRINQEEKIKYIGLHDNLTGVYNRAYFDEEIKRFDTQRKLPISLIMVDINNLKLINDALGHVTGDLMIIETANILKKHARGEDFIARYGGDEFIIFLPETDEDDAESIIKRILNNLQNKKTVSVPLSISTGCATKNDTSQEITGVLRLADKRMYSDKLQKKCKNSEEMLIYMKKRLRERDDMNIKHCKRLMQMVRNFAEYINLPEPAQKSLENVARLHDIGKIVLPKEVIQKKEKLTEKELENAREYPEVGHRILSSLYGYKHIADDILHQHEKWDGTGYPYGLRGEDIPVNSRIISILNTYDILSNGCPYKGKMSFTDSLREVRKNTGKQFDPVLADKFINFLKTQESREYIKSEDFSINNISYIRLFFKIRGTFII
jgi:diguanylate cyclase (GGDEF)-like protein